MGDGNYVVMHLHSMFSNGVTNVDSITDYKEYVARAKELGMKAMCFTEHGSVFSWLHKKEEIEKAGMKYIHGIEAYVTENLTEKIRDNYHCVLIAKNYEGVLELNTLVSGSFNRQDGHFYYVPRITLDELENTSDNIIISTACLGGILNKGNDSSRDRFISFLWRNKHRCFLEIQHHMVEDQIKYNKYLYELSKSIDVPLIAGTDTHALNDEHLEGRAILQKAKNVNFADEQAWDLTFKSYDELVAAYEKQKSLPMNVILEAIQNTNVLADMIEEFTIDRSYKYPHLWEDPEGTFRKKIAHGIKWRGVDKYPNYQEYLDRIEYEMKAYVHNQAIDFMLLMDDIISWCKTQDIQVGYGRGSVNGSVIAWLLGITEMDSIKHKLNFDRFMNIERVSLSDIDTDFPPSRIEEVKNYLFNRHGLYCSDIITFNTIADKGAIRDVGRALNIPLPEVGEICDAMDNEERAAKMREEYPKLFRYVDLVKGTIVSIGSHPCGTIVCGFEFSDKIGTCSTATSNYRVSQLNMKEVDSLNYVKLDLLKLDTIELINETCKLAGIERPNPSTIDDNDIKVWNSIRDDTTSIFQWESQSASAYLRQLFSEETIAKVKEKNPNFSYIDLFAIGNGAIRPAGESYRDALSRGEYHLYGNEALDRFMAPTLGYCIEENQKVQLLDCEKKIKEVNVGDIVYTMNGLSFVDNVVCNGEKHTLKIKTRCGDIECTDDHKILSEYGWIEANKLKIGDTIAYRIGCESNKEYPEYKLKLIGYLIGDGILNSRNNVLFVNRDIDVINNFKECVEKFDNCTCSITNERSRVNKLDLFYANVKHIVQHKRPTECARWLIDIGMKYEGGGGILAKYKAIPEFVFSLSKQSILVLLGAYSDTDSSITKSAIQYKTGSIELAYGLARLIRLCGYVATVCYTKKTDSYTVVVSNAINFFEEIYWHSIKIRKRIGRVCLQRVRSMDSFVHLQNIKGYLENKITNDGITFKDINKISGISFYGRKEYITARSLHIVDQYFHNYIPSYLINQNLKYVKITGIEDNGSKNVYDLTIHDEHNFVCNGFVVHNCVYQEEIIEFLHTFCGYTMGMADQVRRGFSKKLGTDKFIPDIKAGFIKTMKEEHGVEKDEAEKLITTFIKVIEDASDYLFSQNHSKPYSYEGYVCGYLRTYYPLEFMTTALNVANGNEDKTRTYTMYAKSLGIVFKSPEFGHSRAGYYCNKEENAIYKGIGSLKFMTETVADEIVGMYDKHFDDFVDILFYMKDYTTVNTRQIDILIKIDFFKKFGDINRLLYIAEKFQLLVGKHGIKKDKLGEIGVTEEIVRQFSENESSTRVEDMDYLEYCAIHQINYFNAMETCCKYRYEERDGGGKVRVPNGMSFAKFVKTYNVSDEDQMKFATKIVYGKFDNIDIKGLLKELLRTAPVHPCSLAERLKYQIAHLGYIDYVNPDIADNKHICVTALDTSYSPKFQAYNLRTGGTCEVKVHSKLNRQDKSYTVSFQQVPFENGDILYMKKCSKKPKQKKNSEGEWVSVPGEFNWWIDDYSKIYNI